MMMILTMMVGITLIESIGLEANRGILPGMYANSSRSKDFSSDAHMMR